MDSADDSSESESEEEGTGPVAMETIASEPIACTSTYTHLKPLPPNTVTSSPLVRDDVSKNVLTIGMVGKWADCVLWFVVSTHRVKVVIFDM